MKYKILILLVFLPFILKSQSVLFSAKPIDFEENKRKFLDFEYDDFNVFGSMKYDFSKPYLYDDWFKILNSFVMVDNKEFTLGADVSKRLGLSEYITVGLRYNISSFYIDYINPIYGDQALQTENTVEKYYKTSLSLFIGNEYRLPRHKVLFGAQLYYNLNQKLIQKTFDIENIVDFDSFIPRPSFVVKDSPFFTKFEASIEAYYLTNVISLYAKYRLTNVLTQNQYSSFLEPDKLTFGICVFILR